MRETYVIINEPKFLFFIIENALKNYTIGDIDLKLEGFTELYELEALINVPFEGHFNCCIKNGVLNEKSGPKSLQNWWFHVGLKNNGQIIEIGDSIDLILKENRPYIVILVKK